MAVKSSISLADEQDRFAKALVDAGRYSDVSAVLQQGVDMLRQRMQDDDLQRPALKSLLDQRNAGAFVSGAQMDRTIARMVAEKRRAHEVQNQVFAGSRARFALIFGLLFEVTAASAKALKRLKRRWIIAGREDLSGLLKQRPLVIEDAVLSGLCCTNQLKSGVSPFPDRLVLRPL